MPVRAPFDEEFLKCSTRWLGDAELRDLIMAPPVNRADQRLWFDRLTCRDDYRIWGIAEGGLPVGTFGLKNITSGEAEYWGYIGEREYWGRGIGKWMIREALSEARCLGLSRVYLKVIDHNRRAIRLYEREGFLHAGRDGRAHVMEITP